MESCATSHFYVHVHPCRSSAEERSMPDRIHPGKVGFKLGNMKCAAGGADEGPAVKAGVDQALRSALIRSHLPILERPAMFFFFAASYNS